MISYVKEGVLMAFDQHKYISEYNKENYKLYQFRVKKSNIDVLEKLDSVRNRNDYILSLVEKDIKPDILTIKQIKQAIIPILNKHNIYEIYLFGSYARGEATNKSDVDIYCEDGDIKDYHDLYDLENELKTALYKDVDIIFTTSKVHWFFKEQLMIDRIKL